jgi:hypothetical protein
MTDGGPVTDSQTVRDKTRNRQNRKTDPRGAKEKNIETDG